MFGTKQKLKKWLLISGGTASVILGVIGIIVPVLPTTPFLLLAAICYMRSSERLYLILTSNHLCGSYIRNYLTGRGMTLKAKILTLALLWIILGATAWLVIPGLWVIIVLFTIGIGVTIHILLIHTLSNSHSVEAGDQPRRLKTISRE